VGNEEETADHPGAASPTRFALSAPAVAASLPDVRRRLTRFLEDCGFDDANRLADIRLAVTEACGNVIRHAYQPPDTGSMDVDAEYEAQRVTVRVRDRGRGIERRTPDPGLGLGLRLIHATTSSTAIDSGASGTTVEMVFARREDDRAGADV
jgi:serine/threonine-protein kinase RsbW